MILRVALAMLGKSSERSRPRARVPRRGQDLWGVLTADATGVLAEGDVADIVQPVLDPPVATVEGE